MFVLLRKNKTDGKILSYKENLSVPFHVICSVNATHVGMFYMIHIYRFGVGLQSSFIRVVCSYIKFNWTEYVRR